MGQDGEQKKMRSLKRELMTWAFRRGIRVSLEKMERRPRHRIKRQMNGGDEAEEREGVINRDRKKRAACPAKEM